MKKISVFFILFLSSTSVFSVGMGDVRVSERQHRDVVDKPHREIRDTDSYKHIDDTAARHLVPDKIREAEREQVDIEKDLDNYAK